MSCEDCRWTLKIVDLGVLGSSHSRLGIGSKKKRQSERGTPVLSKTGSVIAWALMCLVLSGGLTGCTVASLVGANSQPAPATHDLLATSRRGLGHLPIQLTVNEPSAVEALSSSRIAIKPGPHEISYFAAAVWTDKLPRLLQIRLIETFENSRILKAVSSGNDRIRGDLGLAMEIRDFQVEVNGGVAQAHVRLFVKLVDEDKGIQVSAREFSASVNASNDRVEAGVEALKGAFAAASVKIMRWIVKTRIILADAGE